MASARITIARVLAALTLGCAGVAFWLIAAVREPFPATVYDTPSEAEWALAVARANCEEHERSTGLARWSRGDANTPSETQPSATPWSTTTSSSPPACSTM